MSSAELLPDRTRRGMLDGAVRELAFAVQALDLYPSGSPVIRQAVDRAHAGLLPLLRHAPLRLDVLPTSFQSDDREIGAGNPAVERLAEKLHHRRVARLHMDATLRPESLLALAEGARQDREELEERGGLARFLEGMRAPGLEVDLLQLARMFEDGGAEVSDDRLWTTLLDAFADARDDDEVLRWGALAADPARFGHFLAWMIEDAGRIPGLAGHSQVELLRLVAEQVGEAATSLGGGALAGVVRELRGIYGRIHPEAWIELLAEPLEIDVGPDAGVAGKEEGEGESGWDARSSDSGGGPPSLDLTGLLSRGLERSQVEELILYSVRTRERPSPRLVQLFSRVLEGREDREVIADAVAETLRKGEGGEGGDDPLGVLRSWPSLREVLLGEDPGPFVTQRYQATLDLLGDSESLGDGFEPLDRIRARVRGEMDPLFLLHRKCEIYLSLLEAETEATEYGLIADEIEKALPEFVLHEDYEFVERLVGTFARHKEVAEGGGRARREAAGQVLVRFCNRHTLLQLGRSLIGKPPRVVEAGIRIFPHLGELAVPPIFNALSQEKSRAGRLILLQVLIRMGDGVLPTIEAHLQDERWFIVRNLVSIIRELGGPQLVGQLRITIRHPDARVRRESALALANIDVAEAGEVLLGAVEDEDRDTRIAAIQGLGLSGHRVAIPVLRRFLELSAWSRENAEVIEAAAVALGRLGDESAIPRLRRLARKPWFYRSHRMGIAQAAGFALQTLGEGGASRAPIGGDRERKPEEGLDAADDAESPRTVEGEEEK